MEKDKETKIQKRQEKKPREVTRRVTQTYKKLRHAAGILMRHDPTIQFHFCVRQKGFKSFVITSDKETIYNKELGILCPKNERFKQTQKNHHHHHQSRPQPNGLSLMSKRGVARIDYRILNSEGVVTPHIESLSNDLLTMSLSNTSGTTMTDLQADTMVIMEEVKDTIEENHFSQLTATELETILQKLESLRQQLRRRSLQIGTTELPITQTLDSIKEFIVSAKDFKVKMRLWDDKMPRPNQRDQLRS